MEFFNPRLMKCVSSIVLVICGLSDAAIAAPADQSTGDTIIVTGTRQANRTVADSMSPIDVISAEDLEKTGADSVRDMIGSVTPSANVSNAGAGASFAVKTLSLRGLSSDQTLVLVNGKRRHDTSMMFVNGSVQQGQSPADLDLIPTSAIDHIEVLRDGASVQYGSDALAGVVNIILKSGLDGTISAGGGMRYDNGDGLRGDLTADDGVAIGNGGVLHLFADISGQGKTNRAGVVNNVSSGTSLDVADDKAYLGQRMGHQGQPGVSRFTGGYNMTVPLSDTITAYSYATGANRDSNAFLTYRLPNAANSDPALYPLGHSPRLDMQDEDYQIVGGLKGDAGGVHWDLSTSYGENQTDYREMTAYNAFLNRGGTGSCTSKSNLYTPLCLGADGQTNFYIGQTRSTEWVNNLDLNKDFSTGLFEDPLFVSIGGEYRKNSYGINPGETNSWLGPVQNGSQLVIGSDGVTGFPPFVAGEWRRNNYSFYADVDQTLFKGFDLSGAVRWEDYSDFGSTTNEKGSFRYEPIQGYAVRGTVSTGFRAPTLQQEHYASASTIGIPGTSNGAGGQLLGLVQALPPDSAAAKALGAQPLKAEKSTSYSVGLVVDPLKDLTVSLDAYQIKITDRVLLSGTLTGTAVTKALTAAGYGGDAGGFYFGNFADTTTKGLDLVANYTTRFDEFGAIKWGLAGNLSRTWFDSLKIPSGAPAGLTLIDRATEGNFTKANPSSKLVLDADWMIGQFDTFLRVTRYGSVLAENDNIALDEKISPKFIVDLSVGYDITDNLRAMVGADNLFNTYPPHVQVANQSNGAAYYNAASPWGISGGYYYGRVSYKF